MINELRPLGCYEYASGLYSKPEALDKLTESHISNEPIVCIATHYDEVKKTLFFDYHGVIGSIKNGYITQNAKLKPQDIVGKTTKVRVTRIFPEKNNFFCERISVEYEAFSQLKELNNGDIVEGIVKAILDDRGCAFIDLKEGYCAYLIIGRVTRLPSSCCYMSEFISINERVRASVYAVSLKDPRKSGFKVDMLSFLPTWEEKINKLAIGIGDVIEGKLRADRLKTNIYYLILDNHIYIKVRTENTIVANSLTRVKITSIEYDKNEIWGNIEKSNQDVPVFIKEELVQEASLSDELFENSSDETDINSNVPTFYEMSDYERMGSLFSQKVSASLSPFAERINEEKEYENDDHSFSVKFIEHKIKQKHITEDHKYILKIIRTLGYCTSKQIMSYIYSHKEYHDVKSQDKLNKKLMTLVKASLLSQIRFKTDEHEGMYRVYSLNYNGNLIAETMFKFGKSLYKVYPITDSVHDIKRLLSGNQFGLACMELLPTCGELMNQRLFFTQDIPVRPTGVLPLDKSTLLLESVRRYTGGYAPFLIGKLERYNKFFQELDNGFISPKNQRSLVQKPMYLLCICENIEHAREISQLVSHYESLCRHTYFTYDLLIYQQSPAFSLFRFNNETVFYYSLPDLLEHNTECYTSSQIDGFTFHDCNFNSFPEQYLRNMFNVGNTENMSFVNITILDSRQNIEYLYRSDFEGFFESQELSRKKESSEAVWEPRVFFLGNGGSGKTSLIKVMAGQCYNDREAKTDGVQVLPDLWKNLTWMHINNTFIDHISVWDFAGQEYDHAFNSFLMTDSALYIVVLDTRSEDNPDDWLNYIQTYAPHSKVMLVINKMDSEHPTVKEDYRKKYHRINISKYLEMYPNIVGVYQVSCQDLYMLGNELESLKHDICEQILSMEHQFRDNWAKGSQELRDWLRVDMAEEGYITVHDFKKKHRDLNLNDIVKPEFTLKQCAKTGICIYNSQMKNYIVLKPQWLTYGMSKILRSCDFSHYKWQISKDDLIRIVEMKEVNPVCDYEDQGEAFIEILENLGICAHENEHYIFPCFLPYTVEQEDNILSDLSGWYERQISYKIIPPDIFPKLQVKLWAQQWNKYTENPHPRYNPDKGKIVFAINDMKLIAWKENNTITIAVERSDPEAEFLTESEKKAVQKARDILWEIHENSGNSHMSEANVVKESIVLKGRRKDMSMKKVRYPYNEDNLKKICMAGIERRYFPEVDRWYNVAGLLLDKFTDEKMMLLYQQHLVHIYVLKKDESGMIDIECDEKENIGTGFVVPYGGEWYLACCAHETKDVNDAIFESFTGHRLNVNIVDYIYENSKDKDIAVYHVMDSKKKLEHSMPKEILSFRKNDFLDLGQLFCSGYNRENKLKTVNYAYLIQTNSEANASITVKADTENGKFDMGFSGTPMLDLKSRCVFGMLREVKKSENIATIIPIENVLNFLEKSIGTTINRA